MPGAQRPEEDSRSFETGAGLVVRVHVVLGLQLRPSVRTALLVTAKLAPHPTPAHVLLVTTTTTTITNANLLS